MQLLQYRAYQEATEERFQKIIKKTKVWYSVKYTKINYFNLINLLLKGNWNTLVLVNYSHCLVASAHANWSAIISSFPKWGFTIAYKTPVSCPQRFSLLFSAVLKEGINTKVYSEGTEKLRLSHWPVDRHFSCIWKQIFSF